MGWESLARGNPGLTKAEEAGTIITIIIGGTGATVRRTATYMSDRKSLAIDPSPRTGRRVQGAKIFDGTETNRIASDFPRDDEENQ